MSTVFSLAKREDGDVASRTYVRFRFTKKNTRAFACKKSALTKKNWYIVTAVSIGADFRPKTDPSRNAIFWNTPLYFFQTSLPFASWIEIEPCTFLSWVFNSWNVRWRSLFCSFCRETEEIKKTSGARALSPFVSEKPLNRNNGAYYRIYWYK